MRCVPQLLRKLRSFHVDPTTLKLFYNSFVELFAFFLLFAGFIILMLSIKQKIVHFNSRIICDIVRSLFCDQQMLLKVHLVMKDPDHALCGEVERLSHGRRFRSLVCKTNRGANSFVPTAVGTGIAQWLERRTRDRKVAGSNPCRSGGRIFFSIGNYRSST